MHDSSNPHEFTSLERPLEDAGEITSDKSYNFEFLNVDKPYETYNGNNVRLRYFLRVRVARQYASNITKTLDLAVQNLQAEPEANHGIKMEVGIEDWSDRQRIQRLGLKTTRLQNVRTVC
jgi:vacuolar protein sorting-associated protein 26